MNGLAVGLLFAAEAGELLKYLFNLNLQRVLWHVNALNLYLVNYLYHFLNLVQIKHHFICLFFIGLFDFY